MTSKSFDNVGLVYQLATAFALPYWKATLNYSHSSSPCWPCFSELHLFAVMLKHHLFGGAFPEPSLSPYLHYSSLLLIPTPPNCKHACPPQLWALVCELRGAGSSGLLPLAFTAQIRRYTVMLSKAVRQMRGWRFTFSQPIWKNLPRRTVWMARPRSRGSLLILAVPHPRL